MIKLAKSSEPTWILKNAAQKTQDYLAAPASDKPSPWRNSAVVEALKHESHRKCIYCESFVDNDGYGAVEHIRPKKIFPADVLDWGNLAIACTRCNTNKGEYWSDSDDLRLLNPFEDDPSEHLDFQGPLTVPALHSSRGLNTVRQLKLLQRLDLFASRLARIEDLDARLRLWFNESNAEKKALFAEDVLSALEVSREYSGVLIAFARARGFPTE